MSKTKNKCSLRPISDKIVVGRDDKMDKSPGGIVLPEAAQQRTHTGTVLAVGPGKLDDKGERVPMDVEVGDRIFYGLYAGSEAVVDGEEYLILRSDDVLSVIETT